MSESDTASNLKLLDKYLGLYYTMKVRDIVLGIVIVIVIYLVYLWLFGDSERSHLSGMRSAKVSYIIPGSSLPSGGSADYTYSIWLYIAGWNYGIGRHKVIFERLDRNGQPAPSVALAPNLNNIEVTLATYPSNGENSDSSHSYTCTLTNVPLQAWTNVIITLNNRALDLYMNGKLVRTCVLPGVPRMSTGTSLHIAPGDGSADGGGFEGNISNFEYFSRTVNPREAYAIYMDGPGGNHWLSNLFNKYRLKIAFMKDNNEVNSFQI